MNFPLKYKSRDGTTVIVIGKSPKTGNLIGFTDCHEFDKDSLNCIFPERDEDLDLIECIRPDPYGAET